MYYYCLGVYALLYSPLCWASNEAKHMIRIPCVEIDEAMVVLHCNTVCCLDRQANSGWIIVDFKQKRAKAHNVAACMHPSVFVRVHAYAITILVQAKLKHDRWRTMWFPFFLLYIQTSNIIPLSYKFLFTHLIIHRWCKHKHMQNMHEKTLE